MSPSTDTQLINRQGSIPHLSPSSNHRSGRSSSLLTNDGKIRPQHPSDLEAGFSWGADKATQFGQEWIKLKHELLVCEHFELLPTSAFLIFVCDPLTLKIWTASFALNSPIVVNFSSWKFSKSSGWSSVCDTQIFLNPPKTLTLVDKCEEVNRHQPLIPGNQGPDESKHLLAYSCVPISQSPAISSFSVTKSYIALYSPSPCSRGKDSLSPVGISQTCPLVFSPTTLANAKPLISCMNCVNGFHATVLSLCLPLALSVAVFQDIATMSSFNPLFHIYWGPPWQSDVAKLGENKKNPNICLLTYPTLFWPT